MSLLKVDFTLKLRKSTSLFINKFFKSNNLKKILHNTTFLVQLPNIAVSPFKIKNFGIKDWRVNLPL